VSPGGLLREQLPLLRLSAVPTTRSRAWRVAALIACGQQVPCLGRRRTANNDRHGVYADERSLECKMPVQGRAAPNWASS